VAKALWESQHAHDLLFLEAVELCRRCHKIAPFCFFNGNTFASIIKLAAQPATGIGFTEKHLLSSVSAHIVAGTATPEEEKQFKELLQKIT
jgi:hypothetical protein